MKMRRPCAVPVALLCLSFAVISCSLGVDATTMEGEQRFTLASEQKEQLSSLFGAQFVAASVPVIFGADFEAGSNPQHPLLAGRKLAGVYDPTLDKIWIDWECGTGAVVAHELTHRWQSKRLKDRMPPSSHRLALDYEFDDEALELALSTGHRLNCEQEATVMERLFDSYSWPDTRAGLFRRYAQTLLKLPALE